MIWTAEHWEKRHEGNTDSCSQAIPNDPQSLIQAIHDCLRTPYQLHLTHPQPSTLRPLPTGATESEFILQTSGTTGSPKTYRHRQSDLTAHTKKGPSHANDTWGLLFPPNHMAGLQIVLQALLNRNGIVNLLGLHPHQQIQSIEQHSVSHLSATPTQYRQLISGMKAPLSSIRQITIGGEVADRTLIESLQHQFPQAKITNIYATTETGTLLKSMGTTFSIPDRLADQIKVVDDELQVHASMLKRSDSPDAWYPTGDRVRWIDSTHFEFITREGEGINIGGHWVTPQLVEQKIRTHPEVTDLKVSSRANSVLGNILAAQIIFRSEVDERAFRLWMEEGLAPYEIPRWIESVTNLDLTFTGKVKR